MFFLFDLSASSANFPLNIAIVFFYFMFEIFRARIHLGDFSAASIFFFTSECSFCLINAFIPIFVNAFRKDYPANPFSLKRYPD